MDSLKDYDIYIKRMKKSSLDKMFFMDKFFEPVESIVDFGCADGELMSELQLLFPEYRYIGYDISDKMIELAKDKHPQLEFYRNWSDIPVDFNKSLLNISSTLHEVYAYGTNQDVDEFWGRVFESGFKYICIRDMMLSEKVAGKCSDKDAEKISVSYTDKLKDFEKIWGSVREKKNFVHYLLKYKYTENWQREVEENYIPLSVEGLLRIIPENYRITYSDHYILPFIAHQIKQDFGIVLDIPTHFKIILKKVI